VSPSEIAFLALGIVLGAAIGAAIVEAVRSRPAPRREVRVTIAPNSVNPRRSSTLAAVAAVGAEARAVEHHDQRHAISHRNLCDAMAFRVGGRTDGARLHGEVLGRDHHGPSVDAS